MAEMGMDPQAVLAIARTLEQQQRTITHIGSSVDRVVAEARSCWKGSDVGQFAGQWATHKSELRNASTALHELATKAKTNAQDQIRTSNDYSGGGSGSGGGAGSGGGSGSGGSGSGGSGSGGSGSGGSGSGGSGSGGGSGNGNHHGEFHVGPHGDTGEHNGHLGPVPVSGGASGEVGLHGEGNAHASYHDGKLDAGADGSILNGAHGEVHGQVGNDQYNVHGSAEGTAGQYAQGNASITADSHGATIDAHGEVLNGAHGEATGGFTTPIGGADGKVEATVGQSASGDLGGHAGTDGVAAHAGFDTLNGAKEGASYTYHVGPFSGGGGVDAIQGEALGTSGGVSFTTHDVGFDVGGDAADVLGFGGDFSFHVDPTALGNDINTGVNYVGHGVSTGLSDAGHALSKAAPWNW